MFSKLADTVMNHSKAVIALWIVVLVCVLPFGIKSGDVLEYDISQMSGSSTESSDGQDIIDEYFSNSVDLSEILVISYDSSEELNAANEVFGKFQTLMSEKYGDKVAVSNYGTQSKGDATQNGVMLIAIANTGGSDFDLVHETDSIRDIVKQAKADVAASDSNATGLTTYVTGNDAISYDTETSSMKDVEKVDPLSILLIFVLLGLFFYALVTAVVPPAVVGMAYGISLGVIYAIGSLIGVYYITQTLILVSMLGAGCDYAIFIITRYRDECRKGLEHDEALRQAVMWGGEAVFTSGVSVIIGFAALALCDFSLVQTMGICLAAGIALTLFAALTFIPAILNLMKQKIFWPSNIEKYKKVDDAVENGGKLGLHGHLSHGSKRYFSWLARNTNKHSKLIAVALVVLCIPGLYMYTQSEDSADMISVMPDSEAVDGLNLIMTQTDGGTIMPTYVVLELNDSIGIVGKLDLVELGIAPAGTPDAQRYIPYVVWNANAPAALAASATMTKEIEQNYNSIVGSASGINSWAAIYDAVATQMPGAPASTVNNYILTGTNPLTGEPFLPSAVRAGVTSVINMAPNNGPNDQILGGSLTTANVIDGILNVSTGILSDNAQYISVMVITKDKPMSDDTMDFIADLKADLHNGDDSYDSVYSSVWKASYVTGTSASMGDISSEVESQFSMIRIVVAVLLIILLFFILGSYLTPIRAIITIMLSVVLTVALTRFVFNDLLGTPVLFLIPIVLFVVLLGLGMDYEIFMTTKIRENKIKGMSNDDAIDSAIREAGPVISLCALLMGGTFLTLTLANSSMLQEFGFALGVGILIDGLLMVGFVSPALMHLMGDWSWKGPAFLTKKHGMNPNGSSAAATPAVAAAPAAAPAPADAERIETAAPAAVPKEEQYSEIAKRQAKIDTLANEVKVLTDNKRIDRLDSEGEEELASKKAELAAEKAALREYRKQCKN